MPWGYPREALHPAFPRKAWERERIVRKKEYNWDSESDAMEWETAISGMETMERHLKELRKSTSARFTP